MITNQTAWIEFLCEAKKEIYVGRNNKLGENIPHAKEYIYERDTLKYVDRYLGMEQIVGEEAIWEGNEPVWAMNYTGRVVDEGFDINFLLEALSRVKKDFPYRGPRYLELGEYTYKCRTEGEFNWFVGCEKVLYQGKKVYEAMFQGGIVK